MWLLLSLVPSAAHAQDDEEEAFAAALAKAAEAEAATARTQAALDARRPEVEAMAKKNAELEAKFLDRALLIVDWRLQSSGGSTGAVVASLLMSEIEWWHLVDHDGEVVTARAFAEVAPPALAERGRQAGPRVPARSVFSRQELGAFVLGRNRELCELAGLTWAACLNAIERVPACAKITGADECVVGPGGVTAPDWEND